MSALEKLTEGIVARDLQKEGAALLNKWEGTGLLEGLNNDVTKNNMARLLENQAKELLREASTMAAGDVEGFSAVAFPIVRRVFGELIANELVSVQPMSLPSGLIFFLDFTSTDKRLGYDDGASLFGGGKVAKGIADGTDLAANPEAGPYALNNGYAAPTGTVSVTTTMIASRLCLLIGLSSSCRMCRIRSNPVTGSIFNSNKIKSKGLFKRIDSSYACMASGASRTTEHRATACKPLTMSSRQSKSLSTIRTFHIITPT